MHLTLNAFRAEPRRADFLKNQPFPDVYPSKNEFNSFTARNNANFETLTDRDGRRRRLQKF